MQFYNDPQIAVTDGAAFKLDKHLTSYKDGLEKEKGLELLENLKQRLSELQDMLYAQNKHSILLVFQAMDAAGKDGTIKTVMSGVNPQGCNVTSFKKPSQQELGHDYLWRCYKELPERGKIGIFNRSYYEEVLVTRVHPEFILGQQLPGIEQISDITESFWKLRFESIRNFEKHLTDNGTVVLKFFLNVSKEEQKARFLERIEMPNKNWKFNYSDIEERRFWKDYRHAYQEAIAHTAEKHAPWFIIPSDHNWARNLMVCSIIIEAMEKLAIKYPVVDADAKIILEQGKTELLAEEDNS